MNATHAPQSKGASGISWGVAAGVAGVGALLLGAAIFNRTSRGEAGGATVDRALLPLQAQLSKVENELAAAREAGRTPAAELKSREDANKNLAERIAIREGQVKDLERKNNDKIGLVLKQASALKSQTEEERAADTKLREQASGADQEVAKFRASIAEMQDAVVTIVTPQRNVGTGFFVGGFKQPTIVTTAEVAPLEQELSVKLHNAEGVVAEEGFDGTARTAYLDKESGLAFLIFTPKEAFKPKTLSKKLIREAKQGEKVFSIVTQLRGEQFGEFSIFDGTVSAVERMRGTRRLLQLAAPANAGSFGAPVFGADRHLIGVILSPVAGMDKAALAIPATEIQNAMARMIESLMKRQK